MISFGFGAISPLAQSAFGSEAKANRVLVFM
jgi:hypothetical protein